MTLQLLPFLLASAASLPFLRAGSLMAAPGKRGGKGGGTSGRKASAAKKGGRKAGRAGKSSGKPGGDGVKSGRAHGGIPEMPSAADAPPPGEPPAAVGSPEFPAGEAGSRGGPSPEASSAFASWPAWPFGSMGAVLDAARGRSEALSSAGLWMEAAVSWDRLSLLVQEFLAEDLPAVSGALARAARCLAEAGAAPEDAVGMADEAMDGFARAVWDSGDDDGSLRAVKGIIRDEVGFAQDTFDSGMSMLEEMDGGGWPEGMGDAGDGGDSPGAVTSRILYGGALEDEIEAWAMARATEDPGGGSRGDGSRQAQGELPAAGRPDGSPSGAERTSDVASGTQLSRAGASGTAGGHAAASAGRPGGTDFGSRPSGALRGELRRIRVRRGNGHEDTLEAECRLAEALAGEGSHAGALRHLRRAMEGFMRLQGPEGPGTLRVKRLLPDALLLAGEAAEAASMLREELREVREGAGEGSPEELRAMSRLGGALARTGVDGAEAGDLLGRPARLLGDLLGPGHPAVLAARALWTDFLTGSLDPGLGLERALEPADPARKIDLEEVLRFCGTQAAGPGDGAGGNFGGTPDPARVYGERTRKASVLHALGRHGEARAVLEEMLGEAGRTLGPRHPFVLSAMCASAGALAGLDPQASVAEHDRVLQARMELSGDGHPDTAGSYAHLGRALLAAGDPDGALAAWVYAFRALEALGGPYLADAAAIRMRTGRIFMEGGDPDLAFRQYGRAGALWSDLRGPGCPGALEAMEQEARALLACGRAGDGAAVLCRAAFERDAAARPEGRPGSGNGRGAESPGNPGGPESSASRRETAGMLARLAETVLVCGGEPREARAVVAHELELWEAVSGEGSPEALDALYRLARAWEACGCREEARELHGKALQGREKALGSGHPDTEKSRAAFEELEGGR